MNKGKLAIISMTLLASCNSGYQVQTLHIQESCVNKVVYRCERVRPVFLWDETLAICDTAKECGVKCAEAREALEAGR